MPFGRMLNGRARGAIMTRHDGRARPERKPQVGKRPERLFLYKRDRTALVFDTAILPQVQVPNLVGGIAVEMADR